MSKLTDMDVRVAEMVSKQSEMLNPSSFEVFRQSVASMAVHLAMVTKKNVSFRLGYDGKEDENATRVEWT